MPAYYCCVPECQATLRKKNNLKKYPWMENVTFHPFPNRVRTKLLRAEWIRRTGRPEGWDPSKFSRICSQHFVGGRGPTKKNPVPSLYAHNDFGKAEVEKVILTAGLQQDIDLFFKILSGNQSTVSADKVSEDDNKDIKNEVPVAAICIPVEDEYESFELQMDGYPNWLLKEMYILWKQDKFCDVTIKTFDGPCKAHRMVLASHSPVLAQLLAHNQCKTTQNITIDLTKSRVYHNTMHQILKFCYTGSMKVTESTIVTIKRAAREFKMEKVLMACSAFCNEEEQLDNVREDTDGDTNCIRTSPCQNKTKRPGDVTEFSGSARKRLCGGEMAPTGPTLDTSQSTDLSGYGGVVIKEEPEDTGYEASESEKGEDMEVKQEPEEEEYTVSVNTSDITSGDDPTDDPKYTEEGDSDESVDQVEDDTHNLETTFSQVHNPGETQRKNTAISIGQSNHFAQPVACSEKSIADTGSNSHRGVDSHGNQSNVTNLAAAIVSQVQNRRIDASLFRSSQTVVLDPSPGADTSLVQVPIGPNVKSSEFKVMTLTKQQAQRSETTPGLAVIRRPVIGSDGRVLGYKIEPVSFVDERTSKPEARTTILSESVPDSLYGRFSCSICGELFPSENETYNHIEMIHEEDGAENCEFVKMHHCELCGKSFRLTVSKFIQLERHMELVHEKSVTFQCNHCGIIVAKLGQIVQHLRKEHQISMSSVAAHTTYNLKPITTKHDWVNEHTGDPFKFLSGKRVKMVCCTVCWESFDTETECLEHLESHCLIQRWARRQMTCVRSMDCNHCGKVANVTTGTCEFMIKHLQKEHNSRVIISCAICKLQFTRMVKLICHIQNTHKVEPRFSIQYITMKEILNAIAKENPALNKLGQPHVGPYCCKVCNEDFPEEQKCIGHIRDSHEIGENDSVDKLVKIVYHAECEVCGVTGNLMPRYYKLIINHMFDEHNMNMGMLCKMCKGMNHILYSDVRHVLGHLHRVHQIGEDRAVNSIIFGSSSMETSCDMTAYKPGNPQFKPIQKYFGKNIPAPADAEAKVFQCPHCDWGCTNEDDFKAHVSKHKGKKDFVCDICSKKFPNKKCLQGHIKTHGNQQPYVCDQCSYRAKSSADLRLHKLQYDTECPLRCDKCSYQCNASKSLRSHMLNSHDIDIPKDCFSIMKYKVVAPKELPEQSVEAAVDITDEHKGASEREESCPEVFSSSLAEADLSETTGGPTNPFPSSTSETATSQPLDDCSRESDSTSEYGTD